MMSAPRRKVSVVPDGESSILITRSFNAPRELVYDAHTKPELVRRWLLGPEGWTMPVCEIDLRIGGKYREIERPQKIVATEKFDDPWYEGEAYSTLTLTETGRTTTLRNFVTYETAEIRDNVLKSPMQEGLEAGYNRLEDLLTENAKSESTGRVV